MWKHFRGNDIFLFENLKKSLGIVTNLLNPEQQHIHERFCFHSREIFQKFEQTVYFGIKIFSRVFINLDKLLIMILGNSLC